MGAQANVRSCINSSLPQTRDDEALVRRARREARRALQRAQNIIRAADMHAARVTYDLERRSAANSDGDKHKPKDDTRRAYVGCSGWYYWHWAGGFYPESLPRNRWFNHYARRFNTVELNAPFYSWPTVATVKSWKRQIGRRNFLYTVKVNELITHTRRFARTDIQVKDFGLVADLLGEHFGCFLFQLPPSFHYTSSALGRILRQLDPRRRNVVEFRHHSWWNEKVYDAFRNSGAIFCSTSAPRLPEELIRTAEDVYIRFHGPRKWYYHDYTREEIAVWATRARESGAARIWAYFNNDRDGYAITNARELRRQLRGNNA